MIPFWQEKNCYASINNDKIWNCVELNDQTLNYCTHSDYGRSIRRIFPHVSVVGQRVKYWRQTIGQEFNDNSRIPRIAGYAKVIHKKLNEIEINQNYDFLFKMHDNIASYQISHLHFCLPKAYCGTHLYKVFFFWSVKSFPNIEHI